MDLGTEARDTCLDEGGVIAVVYDGDHGKPFQLSGEQDVIQDVEYDGSNSSVQNLQEPRTI